MPSVRPPGWSDPVSILSCSVYKTRIWLLGGADGLRKWGLDICRQCFREKSAMIGFVKVCRSQLV